MSAYQRNILVGLTVILGLLGLCTMLIKFGGTTVALFHRGDQVRVVFVSDRADGLAEGSQVQYRGVSVGRVISVTRDADNMDVIVDTLVAKDLPGNVTCRIRTVNLVSGIAAVELELTGGIDAKPQGKLEDGTRLTARYVGMDLLPPEITAKLESAGDLITGLNSYVNDPAIRQNLQASLQNIHSISENLVPVSDNLKHTAINVDHFSDRLDKMGDEASATLSDAHATVKSTKDEIDKTSRQIDDRMLQISKALDSFQSVTDKIDKGQGTAGLLLNDPKLYQSLVANSQSLNATIADLKRLVEQWEQEGVSLKMK